MIMGELLPEGRGKGQNFRQGTGPLRTQKTPRRGRRGSGTASRGKPTSALSGCAAAEQRPIADAARTCPTENNLKLQLNHFFNLTVFFVHKLAMRCIIPRSQFSTCTQDRKNHNLPNIGSITLTTSIYGRVVDGRRFQQ